MTTDFRALCADLLRELDHASAWDYQQALKDQARAALADEPAVPEGREPASVTTQPSDAELDELAWTWYSKTGSTWYQIEAFRAYARAVLARFGGNYPGSPDSSGNLEAGLTGSAATGEVAELVAWLRMTADEQPHTSGQGCIRLTRAADLLERLNPPQPIPVSERLPEPSVKVLAHYFNALGKGRTICAIWVPAKSRSDEGDLDADDFLEYDEENDKYHWPEGWYEAIENWEELGWAKVYEGEIVYWQPLPQWPSNALPTPEA